MQKITPCLWFDNNAEEAVKFYASIFPNSKIGTIARYGKSAAKVSGRPEGSVMTIVFWINGQEFLALNGGPVFKFTEAISLMVRCKTQQEIDRYWKKLSKGGAEIECGWLKDKYGLSWQIVPEAMNRMMKSKDPQKTDRMMAALIQMKKLDLKRLEKAYKE